MRRSVVLVLSFLVAGCADGADTTPGGTDASGSPFPFLTNHTALERLPSFHLRDPDALGFHQAGLRGLNFTTNNTFKLSAVTLVGPSPKWIILRATNRTAAEPCGPFDTSIRIRSYVPAIDTLTGATLPAGNYSLLVHAPTKTNLTLQFNTTTLAGYRLVNGTAGAATVQALDADPRIESDPAPYRFTFNKTVAAADKSFLLAYAQVAGDSFSSIRDYRSKVETAGGVLCAEHRHPTPQAATGPTTIFSTITAELGASGAYAWSGRFESNTALNPRVTIKADLVRFAPT